MASTRPNWRNIAHELGFTDEKIDAPWPHKDEGRLIKWMEIPKENTWDVVKMNQK